MGRTYVHPDVAAVRRLHAAQRRRGAGGADVRAWIEEQAATVGAAHAAGDPVAAIHLRAVDGAFAARSIEAILDSPLDGRDVLAVVARDHGFERVDAIASSRVDPAFEAALDAIERGDLDAFRVLLRTGPDLATARSAFGHRATLLHHLAANGVEVVRQGVAIDAPRFAMALVEAGADASATMTAYGAEYTTRELLETSAHPIAAGVEREFLHVLDVAGG